MSVDGPIFAGMQTFFVIVVEILYFLLLFELNKIIIFFLNINKNILF